MNLIHRDQYSEILKQAGWDLETIALLRQRYDYIPSVVIYRWTTDDVYMGKKPIQIRYTNPEIAKHDRRMKVAADGYEIESALEIQSDFFFGTVTRGAKGLGFAAVAIPIAVVGSVVGGAIMIYRALN